jgi:hypothetical protein
MYTMTISRAQYNVELANDDSRAHRTTYIIRIAYLWFMPRESAPYYIILRSKPTTSGLTISSDERVESCWWYCGHEANHYWCSTYGRGSVYYYENPYDNTAVTIVNGDVVRRISLSFINVILLLWSLCIAQQFLNRRRFSLRRFGLKPRV